MIILREFKKEHIMKKKIKSTYDKIATDPKRKARIDREYQALLISELIHAAMQKDSVTVRELAKEAGVSPTIIQDLKSGKRKNVTLHTVNRVLNAIGYEVLFEAFRKS
jgi:DNA-binding Xre family transcriptional regulator